MTTKNKINNDLIVSKIKSDLFDSDYLKNMGGREGIVWKNNYCVELANILYKAPITNQILLDDILNITKYTCIIGDNGEFEGVIVTDSPNNRGFEVRDDVFINTKTKTVEASLIDYHPKLGQHNLDTLVIPYVDNIGIGAYFETVCNPNKRER